MGRSRLLGPSPQLPPTAGWGADGRCRWSCQLSWAWSLRICSASGVLCVMGAGRHMTVCVRGGVLHSARHLCGGRSKACLPAGWRRGTGCKAVQLCDHACACLPQGWPVCRQPAAARQAAARTGGCAAAGRGGSWIRSRCAGCSGSGTQRSSGSCGTGALGRSQCLAQAPGGACAARSAAGRSTDSTACRAAAAARRPHPRQLPGWPAVPGARPQAHG